MSRADYQKKFETHPNRVLLKDLKAGDFFVIIDHNLYDKPSYATNSETVWKCENSPKFDEEVNYRTSVFCTTVSLSREKIGYQVTCIYNWFGQDAILIKLPKRQQTIYRHFFKAIQDNDEVHQLGWTDWARKVHQDERAAEIEWRKKQEAE